MTKLHIQLQYALNKKEAFYSFYHHGLCPTVINEALGGSVGSDYENYVQTQDVIL